MLPSRRLHTVTTRSNTIKDWILQIIIIKQIEPNRQNKGSKILLHLTVWSKITPINKMDIRIVIKGTRVCSRDWGLTEVSRVWGRKIWPSWIIIMADCRMVWVIKLTPRISIFRGWTEDPDLEEGEFEWSNFKIYQLLCDTWWVTWEFTELTIYIFFIAQLTFNATQRKIYLLSKCSRLNEKLVPGSGIFLYIITYQSKNFKAFRFADIWRLT